MALGRALLSRLRLLLRGEPLAALDEARNAEILPYIERLRDETRAPAEVARLATAVVRDKGWTGHTVHLGPDAGAVKP